MKAFLIVALIWSSCIFICIDSLASELVVKVGPASPGNGGSNPLALPPVDPLQYEFSYITDDDTEWSFGIVPGLFYGYRVKTEYDLYLSYGFGLAIGANGTGPGIYTAIGKEFTCGFVCFFAEYKQALGLAGATIISPYAIRLGVSYEIF